MTSHHTPYLSTRLLPLVIFLAIFSWSCQGTRVETIQSPNKPPTLNKLPSLEKALEMALAQFPHGKSPGPNVSRPDVVLEVKRNHDLILARREQLEISKEVKGHFEKAVTQAEKKFEEGDENISQSAITKLKLGLAGTLNDISQSNSDIALAQLRLEKYLGVRWASQVDITGPKFQPVDFPHKRVDQFLNSSSADAKPLNESQLFNLKEAFIEVNKAREQLTLAGKNRKMTRALLVTEAANYDFGIGDEAELFEALIIYTRVLVGYYEAMHTYNVSVYGFHSIYHTQ
jgi:Outer membrane efflux protein